MAPPAADRSLTVWRIVAAPLAERAFDGEGSRLYGGRWNHTGTAVVYTSATLSLAALELFVHLEPDVAPDEQVAIAAVIPESLPPARVEISDLPRRWRSYPSPQRLKDLGTAWTREAETVALSVPSAIIPGERNAILNPAHPKFSEIRIEKPEPFKFDPRMWKHGGSQ